MALDISENLTLIRVDLPDKGLVPPLCYRIYITYNPLKDEAHYYTIEMTKEKDVRLLGGVTEDAKHVSYGNAPVEGAELQEIMNLNCHLQVVLWTITACKRQFLSEMLINA